jgi:hypothetical protein
MPVILATQEAEIRRIKVQSQPEQIVHETLSRKNPSPKRDGGVVAQGAGLDLKLQNCKKKSSRACKIHYCLAVKYHDKFKYLLQSTC